jgi:hypothetical protein
MVVGVDVLSQRQGCTRLSLNFVGLSRRRRRLCDCELFMALVGCSREVVVGAPVRVNVRKREEQRRAVLSHGVANWKHEILNARI